MLSKKVCKILCSVCCTFLLVSCGTDKVEKIEGIKLNKGAIIENLNGEYSNYNLIDGKYVKLENKEIIGLYDKHSGNYVNLLNGQYKAFYNGEYKELKDIKVGDVLKLAPKGEYISYFRNEEGYKLKVINLKNNEQVSINSNVSISGTYLDWLDENTLVYYGISNEGKNGLFTYDVTNNKENLFYELSSGYIQFIKKLDTALICIEQTYDDKKEIKFIGTDGKEKSITLDNILNITDILYNGENYYFLGKTKSQNNSLYVIRDNKIKRVIWDFPEKVMVEDGLSVDEEGNILFVGTGTEKNTEAIYKIAKDDSISLVHGDAKDYSFVKGTISQ